MPGKLNIERAERKAVGSQELDIAAITPSPSNPRKDFEPKALAELADNIGLHGVIEPIIVRAKMAAGQAVPGQWELICGERRLRAAKKAGLTTIPAVVREADDAEVLQLQLAENDKRDDLRALERSNAHQEMRRRGLSIEQIAKDTSTSPATVRDSLKLQDLVGEVRKAWAAGELDYSKALVIAKVPPPLQAKVLEDYRDDSHLEVRPRFEGNEDQEEPRALSVRELRALIQRDYMLNLADAPFDLKDAVLVSAAGACSTCPKRTGAQPELFAEVKSADVCLDKLCYQGKCAAFLVRAKKEGRTVLAPSKAEEVFRHSGDDPGYNSGFVRADKKEYGAKKTYGDQVKPDQVVLVQHPETGAVVELVAKSALPKEKHENPVRQEKSADQKRRDFEHQVKRDTVLRVIDALTQHQHVAKGGDEFLKMLIAGLTRSVQQEPMKGLCKRLGIELEKSHEARAKFIEQLDGLSGPPLRRVAMAFAFAESASVSPWMIGYGETIEQAAAAWGVDRKKLEAAVRKELQEAKAEKAAAKKAKKGRAA